MCRLLHRMLAMVSMRAFVASLMLLTACSVGSVGDTAGDDDGSGSGSGDGLGQAFNQLVVPAVTRCVSAVCHGGTQGPVLTSYAKFDAKYWTKPASANILITKAADGAMTHSAVQYLTTAEKAQVSMFLDMLP